jgi:hypothetical protein
LRVREVEGRSEGLQILAETPWDPKILPVDQAKTVLADEPRPYLTNLIDLMAFGGPPLDKVPAGKITVERRRAAIALFEAARRAEKQVLIGSCGRQVDQWIPQHLFDTPHNLGHQDNSISPDHVRLSNEQFSAEFENRSPRWTNVRVEANWFVDWLALHGASSAKPVSSTGTQKRDKKLPARSSQIDQDEKYFPAMKSFLDNGDARSTTEAARLLLKTTQVWGRGDPISIGRRLQRGYNKWISIRSQQLLNSPN